ncbi:hypothetical protein [Salmonirosea aquatica]|uniref:Glycine zipper family protein n=1 Tax=Salmonirosea aquatica TaxID=2654236 RepID=A0A7C9G031_9BACT|nr:hypothetical protein [Cytophagaceae bacterium SJW1-29]
MTTHDASKLFKSLSTETTNKSELKVYEKFIHILNELNNREFTEAEIQSIETELDSLNLKAYSKNRKKYFTNALSEFEKYLKDTFSLISKGYYVNVGISLGMTFGIIIGITLFSSFDRSLGISLGISVGMLIGLTIGRSMESQANAAGKVL